MNADWRIIRFEDAPLEIIDGDRGINYPKQSDFISDGFCLFLNTGNITPYGFDFSDCSFISQEKESSLRKGKLNIYDTVLTTRGTVGNVAFYDDKVLYKNIRINSGMVLLRPNPKELLPRYLYLFVRSDDFRNQVDSLSTGSAQPQLPIRDIKRIEIPIPSLPEQRAIAEVLGSLDDKIELNRRMNATLEAIAAALFKEWFVDNPDAKGWEFGKLGDFVAINECTITKDYPHETIEYIDISSVNIGHIVGTTTYSLGDSPSRAKRLVKHGDTIWSTVRPNRKSYLFINNPKNNLVVSTGFAVLTPKEVPPSYLYTWVTTDQFIDYLVSNADGSAYPAVLPDRFSEAGILIPPKKILNNFEEIVGPMLMKIDHNENESRIIVNLHNTLLPRFMRGEIRLKNP